MTFSTTRLVGSRVLVKGNDKFGGQGQTILNSEQWDDLNAHRSHDAALEDFNAAVEEFFAPIEAAAAALAKATERKVDDSINYIVLHEGEEATAGRQAHVVKLTHDSVVLRLLEQGQEDRLVWVGDTLEVLELAAPTAAAEPAVNEVAEVSEVTNTQA